jgi:uracil-DNA glycosylase
MTLPDQIWDLFKTHLFPVPSCPCSGLFNAYKSVDLTLDQPGADQIRRNNLRAYVDQFKQRPTLVLVGEAPGWRGCRMSGVPFTSEEQLLDKSFPVSGNQSSGSRTPYGEDSANRVWKEVRNVHPEVFLWNAVPFHPHEPGSPGKNRRPTAAERRQFAPLLEELIGLLQPKAVVAVGRVAEQALKKHSPKYVRHPSHGGGAKFADGMGKLRKQNSL